MQSFKVWEAAILLFIGSLFTFFTSWYWRRKNIKDNAVEKARDKAERELIELKIRSDAQDKQIALLSQSVLPLNAAYQAMLVKELTHLHTPVPDELLKKLGPPYAMSSDDERALILELETRANEEGSLITETERDAAKMLPMVIRRAKVENTMAVSNFRLNVVAIPVEGLNGISAQIAEHDAWERSTKTP